METKEQHIGESKLACEFEESTKTASWISSDIYPDGTIYTKEYTQWLENKTQHQEEVIDLLKKAIEIYKQSKPMLTSITEMGVVFQEAESLIKETK